MTGVTDRDLAVDGFVFGGRVGRLLVFVVCLGYSVVLPRQQNRDAGATQNVLFVPNRQEPHPALSGFPFTPKPEKERCYKEDLSLCGPLASPPSHANNNQLDTTTNSEETENSNQKKGKKKIIARGRIPTLLSRGDRRKLPTGTRTRSHQHTHQSKHSVREERPEYNSFVCGSLYKQMIFGS